MDPWTSLAHLTPRHKVGMAKVMLLAAVLALAVEVATPRPVVVLQDVAYAAPGCVGSRTTQVVTATFTLVNRGRVDTSAVVTLSADGTMVASQGYGVPALGSAQASIQATLRDCSLHSYSLDFHYDFAGGP